MVFLYPIPIQWARPILAACIRKLFWCKACLTVPVLMFKRRLSFNQAKTLAKDYYKLESLRQSVGFEFLITKPKVNVG